MTVDVVSLYTGKTLRKNQFEGIKEILIFMSGAGTYTPANAHEAIKNLLPELKRQQPWLEKIRISGKDKREEWLENLVETHGEETTLVSSK